MKTVFLTKNQRARLRKEYDVSECTLSEALHFKRKSVLSRRIRSFAVNFLRGYCLLN